MSDADIRIIQVDLFHVLNGANCLHLLKQDIQTDRMGRGWRRKRRKSKSKEHKADESGS